MSDPRRGAPDFGELAELAADDPRVRGLDASTRARLHAYREFMSSAEPAGARVGEAEARLAETLEREIGVAIAGVDPQVRGPRASAAREPRGLLGALWIPAARPVWAAAAVLVVAGGVLFWSAPRRDEAPLMRGPDSAATDPGAMSATAPTRLPGGALRLEWTPVPDADGYAVVFQAPDLTEIARVEGLNEPRLDLDPAALPAGLRPGSEVLWRALALRGADELARTATAPVELP